MFRETFVEWDVFPTKEGSPLFSKASLLPETIFKIRNKDSFRFRTLVLCLRLLFQYSYFLVPKCKALKSESCVKTKLSHLQLRSYYNMNQHITSMFFSHLLVDRPLVCFHILATMKLCTFVCHMCLDICFHSIMYM